LWKSRDEWRWGPSSPYVSAEERRRNAARAVAELGRRGAPLSPIVIAGRDIARTFWGKAWCANLERYSDYANRLPRGRSYVRNGAVVDLRIAPGEVAARVSGTEIYRVDVNVRAVPAPRWTAICRDCAGEIDSVVALLQGRLSDRMMARLFDRVEGLFPSPAEIRFACSCPDWATMCKHVAAVLYGIGARLDSEPALLFVLRKVDQQDLVTRIGTSLERGPRRPPAARVLDADLSEMFGIEISDVIPDAARRASRGTKAAQSGRSARRSRTIARGTE
jgi:uncharacterized Zn finger protein